MDIEVRPDDLHELAVRTPEPAPLGDGQCRLRIETFGLSTNNVTYAVHGDALRYWDAFPAAEVDGRRWGRVPVWGYAEVVEGSVAGVELGDRFFGFLPMSDQVVVSPGRIDERGFVDVAAHRAGLAGAYNRSTRVAADPLHRPDREPHQMLLFPLFFTSFLIDDFLADNGDFGATDVIVSSASSKTAVGLAHQLRVRGTVRAVGLTSPANAGFVADLDVYDEVVTYDDLGGLRPAPAVYVDIAGSPAVGRQVHEALPDLRHSMIVGDTHHVAPEAGDPARPGPAPTFFFAPAQIARRSQEWGRAGLDERVGQAWHRYADWADGWIRFERRLGPDAVIASFRALVDGDVDPRLGLVCSLTDDR